MKNFSQYLSATGLVALLAVPVIAMASAVHAEEFHSLSGDLSQPGRAATFQRDVNAAATTLCASYALDALNPGTDSTCRAAVWEEAVSQLNASQRKQLAADKHTLSVASTH